MKKSLAFIVFFTVFTLLLSSCKKEIDFDYNEIETIVVVEGKVTNEGTEVMITKTRNVTDSIRGRCLPGATVVISHDGMSETIGYDPLTQCYRSSMKGTAGTTYQLTIDFEGRRYEGTAAIPAAAPILSTEFYWFSMLDESIVVYEMWATDPDPTERNYYWFRMDRKSHHPHFMDRKHEKPYRWNVFDDRGTPSGLIYRDIMCMSERVAHEDKEDDWDRILYEGDTVTFQLMTIDRPTFDYFQSLRAGQSGGANPRSNLSGGCLGYFTAGSLMHADTLVFSYDSIKPNATFQWENTR